jgi:hypothetical protein
MYALRWALFLIAAAAVWSCASGRGAHANVPSKAIVPRSGFHLSPWFGEQTYEWWLEGDVRVVINLPGDFDASKPSQLVIFATPNGNSIEQTLGCGKAANLDWHFDIQHVAAQVRTVRARQPDRNIVLACLEAEGLSFPAWRKKHGDAPAKARRVVEAIVNSVGPIDRIVLTGHSGGGSFVFAFIDGGPTIPDNIERISFLDSNYSYSDESKHGDKLLAWLNGHESRRLTVIAYDDREITLNGKKVVGPTGGTFRATERMVERLRLDVPLTESRVGEFKTHSGLDGRLQLFVHPNPQNKILHTVLVGEMNGVVKTLDDQAVLGGPRVYGQWIQPAPMVPPRPKDAIGGQAFMNRIAELPRVERDAAIAQEVLAGNIPDFLRSWQKVTTTHKGRTAEVEVMPDYLAIGSDDDFVRVPMSPRTAQTIADAWGCSLPTRKIVDVVALNASVKLEPIPLTQDREQVGTFVRHHDLIEKQRGSQALGSLVAGIKKDVVISNRLGEKPNRVAIYGWHKLDGTPIQPLNVSHVNWYVDYSHGVRLVKRQVLIDGKPRDIRHVLHDPAICELLSDEGPIQFPSY